MNAGMKIKKIILVELFSLFCVSYCLTKWEFFFFFLGCFYIWYFEIKKCWRSGRLSILKAAMCASSALPQAWVCNPNPDPLSPLWCWSILGPGYCHLKHRSSIAGLFAFNYGDALAPNTFPKLGLEFGTHPELMCVFQPMMNQWWLICLRAFSHTPHAVSPSASSSLTCVFIGIHDNSTTGCKENSSLLKLQSIRAPIGRFSCR